MQTINIHILVTEEDGWLIAECPSLPGVVTQARTQEELMSNLREAITGWLEVNDERAMAAKVPTANVKNQSLKLAFA